MTNLFIKAYEYFSKHRHQCFGFLTGLIIVILALACSLTYNEDIYDFLPLNTKMQKSLGIYQEITKGDQIVIMFQMRDTTTTNMPRLSEAIDLFHENLLADTIRQDYKDLTCQIDIDKYLNVTDFIYENIPIMLTDNDYALIEEKLSDPQYIPNTLTQNLQKILMPASGLFSTSIGYDPLSLFESVIDRLQCQQQTIPFDIDDGYIFTPDHKTAIITLKTKYGSVESARNEELANYLGEIAYRTMKALPDITIHATGAPIISVENAHQIKQDSYIAIAIAVSIILLLLILSFHDIKKLLLIGCSIAFGWFFSLALLALIDHKISLIVIGLGSIIIGIAVNYPLHFIAHTEQNKSPKQILCEIAKPLLIGNITTVGAFACLIPLDAPALHDLGLFASFMLIGTILFVLIFLPHWFNRSTNTHGRMLFSSIVNKQSFQSKYTLPIIAAITLFLGHFSLHTEFDANLQHIIYISPQQSQLLSDLNISAGPQDTANVYVVYEGTSWDEVLDNRLTLSKTYHDLKQTYAIHPIQDVTAFITSTQEQTRRIERWHTFWEGHQSEVLSATRQSAMELGYNEGAFQPFLQLISKAYEPHDLAYFIPLTSTLFPNSFSTYGGQYSLVDVIPSGNNNPTEIESIIEQESAPINKNSERTTSSIYTFDIENLYCSISNTLSSNFNYICTACGFIVFIFLWISFGQLPLALLAFLPMAISWIWILGLMQLLDIQFNIVNVILATFIFGQGDDYTIFMVEGLIEEHIHKRSILPSFKNSIITSALIMFIGMGSLIVAKHPILYSLAELTIIGMSTVVLMAWVLPQILFKWLIKAKVIKIRDI